MLVSDCMSLVNATHSLLLLALVDSSFVECKTLGYFGDFPFSHLTKITLLFLVFFTILFVKKIVGTLDFVIERVKTKPTPPTAFNLDNFWRSCEDWKNWSLEVELLQL